jgi:hypothetical protein
VALSQARILYQNHSGDYPQVILTIPVTCRTIMHIDKGTAIYKISRENLLAQCAIYILF